MGDTWLFDMDTEQWQPLSFSHQRPTNRFGHVSVVLRMQLLVYGGMDENSQLFDDLWIRSFADVRNITGWSAVTTTAERGQSPGPRVFATSWTMPSFTGGSQVVQPTEDTEKYLYLLGGIGQDSSFTNASIHRFDVVANQWSLFYASARLNATTLLTDIPYEPSALIQSAGAFDVMTNCFFLFGGRDSSFQASATLSRFTMNGSSSSWSYIFDSTPPPARWQHTMAALNGRLYMGFGLNQQTVFNDMFVYDVQGAGWYELTSSFPTYLSSSLTYSWSLPRPLAGSSLVAYGNSLHLFGGSSAQFEQSHAPNFLSQENWKFTPFPVCQLGEILSFAGDSPTCSSCGPGTVREGHICKSCQPGSFWVASNLTTNDQSCITSVMGWCKPCELGEFGSTTGASSHTACVPCPESTFANQTGSPSCFPCPIGSICPIGSSEPSKVSSTGTVRNATQPMGFEPGTAQAVAANSHLDTAFLSFVGLLILGYFMQLFGILPYYESMWRFDWLFDGAHGQQENKPSFTRKTVLGGYFTFISFGAVLWVICGTVITFRMDNISEQRALIPNIAVDPDTMQTFSATFIIDIRLVGFDPLQAGFCNTKTGVSTPQLSELALNKVASSSEFDNESSSCNFHWECIACTLDDIQADSQPLHFGFQSEGTFATSLEWSVSTSGGYPDQFSVMPGVISPALDSYLRGPQPSTVVLRATRVLYRDLDLGQMTSGFVLAFESSTPGSQVQHQNFFSTDGLSFALTLIPELTTLDVSRSMNMSAAALLTLLFAAVTGMLGAVQFFFGMAESSESFGFSKTSKFRHFSADYQLEVIQAEYEESIVKKSLHAKGSITSVGDDPDDLQLVSNPLRRPTVAHLLTRLSVFEASSARRATVTQSHAAPVLPANLSRSDEFGPSHTIELQSTTNPAAAGAAADSWNS